MILAELRNYIQQRQQVSLADIINHFDVDEQAVRPMLEVWINKGKIHRKMSTASCGSSCSQCQTASTEFYIWGQPAGNQALDFITDSCRIKS